MYPATFNRVAFFIPQCLTFILCCTSLYLQEKDSEVSLDYVITDYEAVELFGFDASKYEAFESVTSGMDARGNPNTSEGEALITETWVDGFSCEGKGWRVSGRLTPVLLQYGGEIFEKDVLDAIRKAWPGVELARGV